MVVGGPQYGRPVHPDADELAVEAGATGPAVLAAADIGTNSVHMVVARVGEGGRVEILAREKEMVRLGRAAGDMKQLAPDAIDRGVAALARCRALADVYGAELAAVATSAVREAENRREFLDRAYDEAGVSVDVISGFEEARLIHLGVLQALPVFDQQLLLCDIGGGSTELLVGKQGDVLASRSFKLGAIRLTERFLAADKVRAKDIERARHYIRTLLATFAVEVRRLGFDTFVGSSGTIETIVAMAVAARGVTEQRTLNAERVTAAEIDAAVELLLATPPAERGRLAGVDPRRADILLGGALILEQLVAELGIDELVYSDYALREGVLLDAARRRSGATLHHLRDLRRRSVLHLLELTDDDPGHSMQVARLALDLFDELRPLHRLGDDARELLEAGALLCNVGVFISHSGHHRHSYYVIRNSEHLAGFTDREIELIAQIARYHRKSSPKLKHPEWAALRRSDRELVETVSAILRIAIGLDRAHDARVDGVVSEWDDEGIRIRVRPRAGAPVDLECYSADARKELLEEVFGRPVSIEAVELARPSAG